MNSLNATSVNLLCSGQVITCVLDAIKELIENSLDAGAKTIRVKLEDLGLRALTVTDDGSGITRDGRHTCAHAYTTSKISSIDDLTHDLSTFGFRGEAIHSLCCVAEVTITTRCTGESTAERLTFDHDGNVSRLETVTAPIGTTVTASDLLSVFPVRVREERVNFSVDALKNLLSKYYLAVPTVRFVVDASPHLSQTRPPLATLTQAVAFEFGTQVAASLVERTAEGVSGDIRIRLKAVVPGPTSDWKISSTSRSQMKQFLLVNGRPVRNNSIEKQINEACWKRFGSIPKRMPRFVVCIDFYRDASLCSSMLDINVEPSKSHVLFADNGALLKLIDSIMSFEQPQLKLKKITEWPSKSISIDPVEIDIAEIGSTAIWKDAGTFNDLSLFSVTDFMGRCFLVAAKTNGIFEVSGVSRSEAGRTDQSELILMYWEQFMELNQQDQQLFALGQVM
jgi:DNA mismatch repair protein MutL